MTLTQHDEIEFKKTNNEKRKESDISNTLLRFCVVEAEKLLEKEKQQIIDFGATCQMIRDDVSFDGNIDFTYEPEEYYNEKYNNKTDDKN